MTLENLALLSRPGRLSVAVVMLALIGALAWTAGNFLQPAVARHIVLASGLEDSLFHQYAKRKRTFTRIVEFLRSWFLQPRHR